MAKGLLATASITVKADAMRVWRALIDPGQIKEYLYGTNAISDWRVGSSIVYRGEWKGQAYEDKGTILEMEPGRKFVSTYWSGMSGKPDVPENYVTVTYELSEHDNQTQIVLTQDGNDSEAAMEQSVSNWNMVLSGMKKLIESD